MFTGEDDMALEEVPEIRFKPIGVLRSPFKDLKNMPIQPTSRNSASGHAEVLSEYLAALKDLDGFSHAMILYHFHKVERCDLQVTPFLDDAPRGVFSTRAPTRPNPIGLSVLPISAVEGCKVHFAKIDVLDGTPLLDIKPYVPDFDRPEKVRTGWLAEAKGKVADARSDGRFE
jgi:tRNA-Thr(GGU) m(6)t(6)A37 methyltransferase TsaA